MIQKPFDKITAQDINDLVSNKPIQGFPDGPVIILRIPDSWNKPHMVTTNGRFYARTNSGKYQMDTNELRDAFLQSEQLPNRIRAFRDERIKTITNQPPVNLPARPKLILHLIPFQAMRPGFEVDIKALDERTEEIHPYRTIREWQPRYNLDGFLTRVNPENDGSHLWYVLVFRNGIIELVHTAYLQEQQGYKVIHPTNIEREVIDDTTRLWRFQQSLGLEPPLILMLTLANVLGYTLAEGPRPGVDRDTVLLPEALIQEPAPSTPSILRPMFDALWQACGRRESQSYKPDGNWKP